MDIREYRISLTKDGTKLWRSSFYHFKIRSLHAQNTSSETNLSVVPEAEVKL